MENLNKKMYRGFHIKLDSELDEQLYGQQRVQLRRQLKKTKGR
jgi:hypothetical protein